MRMILLTCLTMLAFASNSLLNRMALAGGEIDAISFALIRIASGTAVLVLIALVGRRGLPLFKPGRVLGAVSLTAYLFGFSIAYNGLDAGIGALILFGLTQIVMFAGGAIAGEAVSRQKLVGAGLAFGGLVWLLWPTGDVQIPALWASFMIVAGIAWGLYSLAGRGAGDPLAVTAANFLLATPLCFVIPMFLPVQLDPMPISNFGISLAVISGAITSGLGYALWYTVLPRIGSAAGGLVQLSVPVIAILGGVVFLNEAASLRLIGAAIVVLGGIAYGLIGQRQRRS